MAIGSDLEQKISGMAISERTPGGFVVNFNQIIDKLGFVWHFEDSTHDLEELAKCLFGRVLNLDFVRDSTKEGVVDKVFRF